MKDGTIVGIMKGEMLRYKVGVALGTKLGLERGSKLSILIVVYPHTTSFELDHHDVDCFAKPLLSKSVGKSALPKCRFEWEGCSLGCLFCAI